MSNKSDLEILKKISIEQEFADLIFRDMRSKRYGLTSCCPLDKLQKISTKKEICDWNDNKVPVYTAAYKDQFDDPTYHWFEGQTPVPTWVAPGCGYSSGSGKCIINGLNTDNECLHIYVKDNQGNVMPSFPIYIDGKQVGVTDSNGYFLYKFTFTGGLTHVLDLCHCIKTVGACSQQRVDITVTPEEQKEKCETNTQCDS